MAQLKSLDLPDSERTPVRILHNASLLQATRGFGSLSPLSRSEGFGITALLVQKPRKTLRLRQRPVRARVAAQGAQTSVFRLW